MRSFHERVDTIESFLKYNRLTEGLNALRTYMMVARERLHTVNLYGDIGKDRIDKYMERADEKAARREAREVGLGVYRQLGSLMMFLAGARKITDSYHFKDSQLLAKLYERVKKAGIDFYEGYFERGMNRIRTKVEPYIIQLEKILNQSTTQPKLTIAPAAPKSKSPSTEQITAIIAILGFFSIFLYSMSPNTTGQAIGLSGFNLYLIGIFTFVTAVALYFIYKM